MRYKISQFARLHGVCNRTVWNWIYSGRLKTERTPTNRVLIVEDEEENKDTQVAIYARVSSSENKDNLERQKQRLLDYAAAKGYTVAKTVTEIGSGLNDKRKKLEKLLADTSIKAIIVEHKDRLARFGTNYIETLLAAQGRKIEVVNDADDDKKELMDDFAAVITSFCAKLYGLRRSRRKTEEIIRKLRGEDAQGDQGEAVPE